MLSDSITQSETSTITRESRASMRHDDTLSNVGHQIRGRIQISDSGVRPQLVTLCLCKYFTLKYSVAPAKFFAKSLIAASKFLKERAY